MQRPLSATSIHSEREKSRSTLSLLSPHTIAADIAADIAAGPSPSVAPLSTPPSSATVALGLESGPRMAGLSSAAARRRSSRAFSVSASFRSSVEFLSSPLSSSVSSRKVVRVSVKVSVVITLALFTLLASVMSWWLVASTISKGVNRVFQQGRASISEVVFDLRVAFAETANRTIHLLIPSSEKLLGFAGSQPELLRVLRVPSGEILTLFQGLVGNLTFLSCVVKTVPFISTTSLTLLSQDCQGGRTCVQQISIFRMTYNYKTHISEDTLYMNSHFLTMPNLTDTSSTYYYLDPTTLRMDFPVYSEISGSLHAEDYNATLEQVEWGNKLEFNPEIGIPQIGIRVSIPSVDRLSSLIVCVYTSVYILNSALQSMAQDDGDRLYMFFHNQNGVLFAASHGKYFSHSDVDFRHVDPIHSPPPVSQFRTYTALNSSDAVITASGEWLLMNYERWDAIPEAYQEFSYSSAPYWLTTLRFNTNSGFRAILVILLKTQLRIGPIQEKWNEAQDQITRFNQNSIIIGCVVVIGSIFVVLGISIAVVRPLQQLVDGMGVLATLAFLPNLKQPRTSLVTEVSRCLQSFSNLRRGMNAFSMFVPREVIHYVLRGGNITHETPSLIPPFRLSKDPHPTSFIVSEPDVLSSGRMLETGVVKTKVITVLFMDVVGFTEICEATPSELLIKVMGEYLQVMCTVIAQCQGTLDKFIGDCIMAMWNAPMRVPNHEIQACQASLKMQESMMKLDQEWSAKVYPELKFRIGVNTCDALVGNIGSHFRLNYSCMGSGVNLANCIEGVNKRFGTVTLVTGTTFERAKDEIFFRMIGTVYVSELDMVTTLYEPLFAQVPVPLSDENSLDSPVQWFSYPPPAAVPVVRQSPHMDTGSNMSSESMEFTNRQFLQGGAMTSASALAATPVDGAIGAIRGGAGVGLRRWKRRVSPQEDSISVVSQDSSGNRALSSDLSLIMTSSIMAHRSTIGDSPVEGTEPQDANLEALHVWQYKPKAVLMAVTALYQKGLSEYVQGRFIAAEVYFAQALECSSPGQRDGPATFMLTECRRYAHLTSICSASFCCSSAASTDLPAATVGDLPRVFRKPSGPRPIPRAHSLPLPMESKADPSVVVASERPDERITDSIEPDPEDLYRQLSATISRVVLPDLNNWDGIIKL